MSGAPPRRPPAVALIALAAALAAALAVVLAASIASQPAPRAENNQPAASATPAEGGDALARLRDAMVSDQIERRGVADAAVLAAMRSVPRHAFVPSEYVEQAYADHPLPIGYGQTISQPYIVALMTAKLGLKPGSRVLEIGAGSGYQAAVLAAMGMQVYTVEIVPALAETAARRLRDLGYTTIEVRAGDGYFGWPEAAPFDAIIVTAAPDHVPQPLVQQLKPGGRLVIPVGPPGAVQTLWQFTADAEGQLTAYNLGEVRFVPFTRSAQMP